MEDMTDDSDAPVPLIILVVVFYLAGLGIAVYIRMSKATLIRKIKGTGRVVSLSQTLISMLMQQMPDQQRRLQISPATGLPPPPPYVDDASAPPYTIEESTPPPVLPNELPPPYVELPPHSK